VHNAQVFGNKNRGGDFNKIGYIRPCKINYLVLRLLTLKKMMREGGYLIFVFICILVQSLGFSGVVTYFSAIMNKY
jgi:hypothetical protein